MRNIGPLAVVGGIISLPLASWAFSPSTIQGRVAPSQWGISSKTTATFMTNEDRDSEPFDLHRAKSGALSLISASVLLLSSVAGGPMAPVQPAFAADRAPPAPTTTTTTKKAAAPKPAASKPAAPKIVDPLASEKAALASSKNALAAASSTLSGARTAASTEQKAFDKAVSSAQAADKRVKAAKAALIDANDRVVEAKAKGDTSPGGLKKVQQLGEKIGTARNTLQTEEASLAESKSVLSARTKAKNAADATVVGATKKVVSAESSVPKVTKNLQVAEKKLAKSTKIAKVKAAKAAKVQAAKDKVAKKKAALAEKARKAAEKKAADKKAKDIAAVKARVKELKTVGKESSSEIIKQEKALQKLGA